MPEAESPLQLPESSLAVERSGVLAYLVNRTSLVRKVLAAGTLVGISCGLTGSAYTGEEAIPDDVNTPAMSAFTPSLEGLKSPEPAKCVEPTDQDIRGVITLFNEPNNPERAKTQKHFKGDVRKEDPVAFKIKEARKFGLTLVDMRPYDPRAIFDKTHSKDNKSGYSYASKPLSEYSSLTLLDAARKYFMQYGITFTAETSAREDLHTRLLTNTELELISTKTAIINLMAGISEIPVELIARAGMHHIGLVRSLGDKDGENPFSGLALDDGAILIDPGKESQTLASNYSEQYDYGMFIKGVLYHELGHEIDRQLFCGRQARWEDKAFRSLNPVTGLYKDEVKIQPGSKDDSTVHLSDADSEFDRRGFLDGETYARSVEGWTDITDAFTKPALITTEIPGGFENVVEDKAGFGNIILQPDRAATIVVNGNDSPTIQNKTMYLLGRMHRTMPNYVRYLADVSDHTNWRMSLAERGGPGAG